ncbi:MAG TPA: sensor histidine kinase [Acidimicrobiales bacterium]|nr:sensor histidine kinase [Acidimicrobiales bacterium]
MKDRPHPLAWLGDHPFVADGMLAALVSVISIVALWLQGDNVGGARWRHPDALAVVIILAATIPLAWRRRRSGTALVVVGTATVTLFIAGYPPAEAGLPILVAFFSAVAHRKRPTALGPTLFTVTVIVASVIASRGPRRVVSLIGDLVPFTVAWIIAETVRNRRAYTAALRERADRLERERASEAREAVVAERARIARELHDVVAHSMSVMVVQAGAARRVLDRDAGQAKEALQSIEETGRQALDEMRRLLGVLRQDDEPAAARFPQPTVQELDLLLEHVREAGLEVSLTIEGDARPLPSGVDLSVFRIVQEALTNTLKHAGAAEAEVVLRWGEFEVQAEVSDNGRGPAAEEDVPAGHGLVGMRERVALYGGDLQVGHRPGGGFRVRATFPLAPTTILPPTTFPWAGTPAEKPATVKPAGRAR